MGLVGVPQGLGGDVQTLRDLAVGGGGAQFRAQVSLVLAGVDEQFLVGPADPDQPALVPESD